MTKSDFDLLREWPGLRGLFDLAWRLFKINLAIVSPDGEKAVCYDSTKREAPFCQTLHKTHYGRRLCWECDRRFFQEALREPKPLRYQCHAGLTEFIMPIIREGRVVALLQCGQVLDTKPSPTNWRMTRELEARQGLDPDSLERSFFHARILPPTRQADLMLFLELVADYLAHTESAWLRVSASRSQEAVGRIMTHIESHLGDDLSLEAIARAVGVSSRTLSRLFNSETGMTVLEFISKRRTALACHYLATTDLSCLEIAFAAGFKSVQNFNRTFRKLKAVTPRVWRLNAARSSAAAAESEVKAHGRPGR